MTDGSSTRTEDREKETHRYNDDREEDEEEEDGGEWVWEALEMKGGTSCSSCTTATSTAAAQRPAPPPPPPRMLIATVNAPHYRRRLAGTLRHLKEEGFGDATVIRSIEPVDLLDLRRQEHQRPALSGKTILYEGWRRILVPHLMATTATATAANTTDADHNNSEPSFVLVAEDDVRLADGVTARHVVDACRRAFGAANAADAPPPDALSLGHAWRDLHVRPGRPRRHRDLQSHLQHNGGAHGTTLLAVRIAALPRLRTALDRHKATHWDQFLFQHPSPRPPRPPQNGSSPLDFWNVALADPPCAGWAEVEETLTACGSGHRRRGGGRKAFVPSVAFSAAAAAANEGAAATATATTTTTSLEVTWVVRRWRRKREEKATKEIMSSSTS